MIVQMARYITIVWLIAGGLFFVVVKPIVLAQTQDTINERARSAIENNTYEINILRNQNLDGRVKNLEDTIIEVKWLGRTAATILLGQLFLGIMSNSRKKTP